MRQMPADASSVRVNSHAKSGNRRGPNTRLPGSGKAAALRSKAFPVAPLVRLALKARRKQFIKLLPVLRRHFRRLKKGFASSSEVSDQNNVAGLRTTSKHKIESICGKSKSKDEIRFEIG